MFEECGLSDVVLLGGIGALSVEGHTTQNNPQNETYHQYQDQYDDNRDDSSYNTGFKRRGCGGGGCRNGR